MRGEVELAPGSPQVSGAAPRVDADDAPLFAAELAELAPALPRRIDANGESIDQGLAKLVLTLVEFIRRLLEHQAVQRMEGGALSEVQVEELGLALMRLREKLDEIKDVFGIAGEELNIDLGPLGRLI